MIRHIVLVHSAVLDLRVISTRYVLATVVACLLVLSGIAYCTYIRHAFLTLLRKAELESESGDEKLLTQLDQRKVPEDFDVELPSSIIAAVSIANLLSKLWYVWVIAILCVCLATAYFFPRT